MLNKEVQQTSLESWRAIKKKIGERQRRVLECLQLNGSLNNTLLAQKLRLPINTITPRVKELRDKGLVEEDFTAPCPITQRNTIYWRAN